MLFKKKLASGRGVLITATQAEPNNANLILVLHSLRVHVRQTSPRRANQDPNIQLPRRNTGIHAGKRTHMSANPLGTAACHSGSSPRRPVRTHASHLRNTTCGAARPAQQARESKKERDRHGLRQWETEAERQSETDSDRQRRTQTERAGERQRRKDRQIQMVSDGDTQRRTQTHRQQGRQRQTETGKDKQAKTDRASDTQRQGDRERDRQTDRERQRERERETQRETDRQTEGGAETQTQRDARGKEGGMEGTWNFAAERRLRLHRQSYWLPISCCQ